MLCLLTAEHSGEKPGPGLWGWRLTEEEQGLLHQVCLCLPVSSAKFLQKWCSK